MSVSRRRLLSNAAAAAAGFAAPAVLRWPANAAEFVYKCGTALPDGHPMSIRGREAMQAIKEQSNGRLDITLYTNSVLGQDTAMLSQTIAGALEMYYLPLDLLAPKNEAYGISASAMPSSITTKSGRRWTATSAIICAALPARSASAPYTIATITVSARSRPEPNRS